MTQLRFSSRELLGVLACAADAAAMPEGAVGCRGTICGPEHRHTLQDLKGRLPQLLHPWQLQRITIHHAPGSTQSFQHGPAKPHPWPASELPVQELLDMRAASAPI